MSSRIRNLRERKAIFKEELENNIYQLYLSGVDFRFNKDYLSVLNMFAYPVVYEESDLHEREMDYGRNNYGEDYYGE